MKLNDYHTTSRALLCPSQTAFRPSEKLLLCTSLLLLSKNKRRILKQPSQPEISGPSEIAQKSETVGCTKKEALGQVLQPDRENLPSNTEGCLTPRNKALLHDSCKINGKESFVLSTRQAVILGICISDRRPHAIVS